MPRRAVATLTGPAVLGTLLAVGIVLAVAILVWNGPPRLRILAIIALIVGFPGLYFALTRGPIVGTLIGVIAVLLTRTKTRLLAVAALVLAVVVLTLSWGRITSSTVYRERATNSGNVQARILLDQGSLKLVEKKPLLGWGYNNFDQANATAGVSSVSVEKYGAVLTSHNTFLTVLYKMGLLGFLPLLIFLFYFFWLGFHCLRRNQTNNHVVFLEIVILAQVCFCVWGGASLMLESPYLASLFWAGVGISLRLAQKLDFERSFRGFARSKSGGAILTTEGPK